MCNGQIERPRYFRIEDSPFRLARMNVLISLRTYRHFKLKCTHSYIVRRLVFGDPVICYCEHCGKVTTITHDQYVKKMNNLIGHFPELIKR